LDRSPWFNPNGGRCDQKVKGKLAKKVIKMRTGWHAITIHSRLSSGIRAIQTRRGFEHIARAILANARNLAISWRRSFV
jgi:hypothetical protein